MEDPFKNYSFPTREMISDAMLKLKLAQLSERVTTGLVQEDTLERFIKGEDEYHIVEYDRASFQSSNAFYDETHEVSLVGGAAHAGFLEALKRKKIVFIRKIVMGVGVDEDDPRRAFLVMKIVDPENPTELEEDEPNEML